jgi:hypothetical protein
MEIIDIPFNKLLGMKRAEPSSGRVLQMDSSPLFTNHVGTFHACAQMALAEASSAEFLVQQFPGFAASFFGVVLRIEAKFQSPLSGKISSRAALSETRSRRLQRMLVTRGRGLVVVLVEVVDDAATLGMSASIEWLIQKLPSV